MTMSGKEISMRHAFWAGLAALAALSGCASEGRVEDRLEEALERRLGPAEEYQVDIEGLTARTGEADLVRAEGVRVEPEGGPIIDRIQIEMREVRYDRDLDRLVGAASVQATAWMRPNDIEQYLEREQRVQSAAVTLEQPDRMRMRFRPELGLPIPLNVMAEVEGTIEGRGSELHYVVSEATAAGFEIDDGMADRLSRLINPIVDLSELPLDLEVTSVRIENGALRVDAIGDVTDLQTSR
jgi:hypothetical protein